MAKKEKLLLLLGEFFCLFVYSRRAKEEEEEEVQEEQEIERRRREEKEKETFARARVYPRNSFAFSESVRTSYFFFRCVHTIAKKNREKRHNKNSLPRTPKKKSGGDTCPFPQPLLRSEEVSSLAVVAARAAALAVVVVSLFVLLVLFLFLIREEKEEACLRGRRNARKRRSGSFAIQIYLL